MNQRPGKETITPMICDGWWFDLIIPHDGTPPRVENARTSEQVTTDHLRRTVEHLWST